MLRIELKITIFALVRDFVHCIVLKETVTKHVKFLYLSFFFLSFNIFIHTHSAACLKLEWVKDNSAMHTIQMIVGQTKAKWHSFFSFHLCVCFTSQSFRYFVLFFPDLPLPHSISITHTKKLHNYIIKSFGAHHNARTYFCYTNTYGNKNSQNPAGNFRTIEQTLHV